MARTTPMKLVELMVLKQDISSVIEFLGKKGNFQFQNSLKESVDDNKFSKSAEIFAHLQDCRTYLECKDISTADLANASKPRTEDYADAQTLIEKIDLLKAKELELTDELKRVKDADSEAHSFANLKVAYSELDHLSFLSLRIGRIDPSVIEELKFAVGSRAVIIPLGEDKTRILAASSKKARFSLDSELNRFGFVNMEIPKDFAGVPDDVLNSLEMKVKEAEQNLMLIQEERRNFAITHEKELCGYLASFAIDSQIEFLQKKLESTSLVYRITGWIPDRDCHDMMTELDKITEGRIAIRVYKPNEVPSIVSGSEKVPVQLHHGKLVGAFERMIFSYGAPVYGTIDPTPFVAIFFTLLFGIMFGDAGQGLVFLLLGILMSCNAVKVGTWNKFAPIFIAIGCSSMIMGFLTGEFFASSTVLLPVSRFIKSLFGVTDPHKLNEPILEMMPNASRITNMFIFFGFTVCVGFVINSIGLIINIVNNLSLGRIGKALFGKTGISGSVFFWYVIALVVRVAAFMHEVNLFDMIFIGVFLVATAFSEPLIRLVDGEHPIIENGLLAFFIEAFVEVLELLSNYLSSTVSFLRVGAFALAHAVLGYIISSMSSLAPAPGGVVIMLAGNAIVVVLEGMIVAIQVIRLQYYEFFSKFFNETGREFKPFAFEYK